MSEGEQNPFVRLAAAARGDLTAQRGIADEVLRRITQDQELDSMLFIEGLMFARLAAAHGDQHDSNRLIGLMSMARLFVGPADATSILAEALARVSLSADNGCEGADLYLNASAAEEPPEVVALSHLYRTLISEAV